MIEEPTKRKTPLADEIAEPMSESDNPSTARHPLLLANEVTRVAERPLHVLVDWMRDNAAHIATQLKFLHSIRPDGPQMGD